MAQPAPDSTPNSDADVSTTRLTAEGSVEIPAEIRDRLDLRPGMAFTVEGEEGTVVLKLVAGMTPEEFEAALNANQAWAREVGLTPADLEQAIREVRAEMREERETGQAQKPDE